METKQDEKLTRAAGLAEMEAIVAKYEEKWGSEKLAQHGVLVYNVTHCIKDAVRAEAGLAITMIQSGLVEALNELFVFAANAVSPKAPEGYKADLKAMFAEIDAANLKYAEVANDEEAL